MTPGIWTGVIGNAVWQLKQTDTDLFYQVFRARKPPSDKVVFKYETDVIEANKKENNQRQKKGNQGVKKIEHDKQEIKGHRDVNVMVLETKVKQEVTESLASDSEYLEQKQTAVDDCDEAVLRDYFQLNINLEDLYRTWAKTDKHFENVSKEFTGIRMLRQDPVECLFSFICSTNNNISRITSMVDKLAQHYGEKIDVTVCGQQFYVFPRVEALAQDGVEENLRQLGFGYRAKYIQQSARFLQEYGLEWLTSLRSVSYREAKSNLLKLCGVGSKVADCVALMCLDKPGSVPVDTHVWQIAARDYMPKLKQAKSLTDKLCDEIGDYFRSLWGDYAGWAHSVLFTADLRQFQEERKHVKHQTPVMDGNIKTVKRKKQEDSSARDYKVTQCDGTHRIKSKRS